MKLFTGWIGSIERGCWWFRVRGYGLMLKARWNEPLFSERNGFYKYARFCGWRLRILTPCAQYSPHAALRQQVLCIWWRVRVNNKGGDDMFSSMIKRIFCHHEFHARDMRLRDEYGIVKWACQKCMRVFQAECGIDILSNGKCIGGWGQPKKLQQRGR